MSPMEKASQQGQEVLAVVADAIERLSRAGDRLERTLVKHV